MSIENFVSRHKNCSVRSIDAVIKCWEQQKGLDSLLHAQVAGGLILGDLLVGDGLLDQIDPELLGAFNALMGGKADTYSKVRRILLEKIESGDASVLGLVNKIKGQVGESRFINELGDSAPARLASLGNQEGWDVAIEREWGTQYVQVKMYGDPDGVVRHMKAVSAKLDAGNIIKDGDALVASIDFAVPENIADEVARKAAAAGLEMDVIPIKMTAEEAAEVVRSGVDNVGPEILQNFFGEMLGIAGNAAVLHGIVSAFMVYKGAKQREELLGDVSQKTFITVGGALAGGATELLLHKVAAIGAGPAGVLVFGASMSTRAVLQRLAKRTDYVTFLRREDYAVRKLLSSFA